MPWNVVGNLKGAKGDPGDPGGPGARGTMIFDGNGAPADPLPGALPGDKYIDLDTGDYYNLT